MGLPARFTAPFTAFVYSLPPLPFSLASLFLPEATFLTLVSRPFHFSFERTLAPEERETRSLRDKGVDEEVEGGEKDARVSRRWEVCRGRPSVHNPLSCTEYCSVKNLRNTIYDGT